MTNLRRVPTPGLLLLLGVGLLLSASPALGLTEGHLVQFDPYTGERWQGPLQDLTPDEEGGWRAFWHERLPTGHRRPPAPVCIRIDGRRLELYEEKDGEHWRGTWRREGREIQASGRWIDHDEARGSRDLGRRIRRRRRFDLHLTLPPGPLPVHSESRAVEEDTPAGTEIPLQQTGPGMYNVRR